MDIKQLIKWGIDRWWWFVISWALCGSVGIAYYLTHAPRFAVEAVLMLRQTDNESGQAEMMQMMGFGGNKITGDEVQVLSSRDLMGKVVDTLGLATHYEVKGKRFWKTQYPQHDLTVSTTSPVVESIKVVVNVTKSGYKLTITDGEHGTRHLKVSSLATPLPTAHAGNLYISLPDTITEGSYRAVIYPRIVAIDRQLKEIKINRLSRESNIITLSTITDFPPQAVATINMLLNLYNQESGADKNRLAIQTAAFLQARIGVVASELDVLESELASYRRTYHIADLDKTADTYQQLGTSYEQQVAEIDAQQRMLDFLGEQLEKEENAYMVIPINMVLSDVALQDMINEYNANVMHRSVLLQTATTKNKVVEQETALIDQQRTNIRAAILNTSETMKLRRSHILSQQNQYDSRLEAIPETERHYIEMQRDRKTKENQYLYLIEKQEENSLLMSSEALPAKIVQYAQPNPNKQAPKLKIVGFVALLVGLLLPYMVFLFGLFKKELL